MTKPIHFNELKPLMKWWNNREVNNQAWKVNINDLKDWDLDIKNPVQKEKDELKSSSEIILQLNNSFKKSNSIIEELKNLLN